MGLTGRMDGQISSKAPYEKPLDRVGRFYVHMTRFAWITFASVDFNECIGLLSTVDRPIHEDQWFVADA
jgi:hypothetical protein